MKITVAAVLVFVVAALIGIPLVALAVKWWSSVIPWPTTNESIGIAGHAPICPTPDPDYDVPSTDPFLGRGLGDWQLVAHDMGPHPPPKIIEVGDGDEEPSGNAQEASPTPTPANQKMLIIGGMMIVPGPAEQQTRDAIARHPEIKSVDGYLDSGPCGDGEHMSICVSVTKKRYVKPAQQKLGSTIEGYPVKVQGPVTIHGY